MPLQTAGSGWDEGWSTQDVLVCKSHDLAEELCCQVKELCEQLCRLCKTRELQKEIDEVFRETLQK